MRNDVIYKIARQRFNLLVDDLELGRRNDSLLNKKLAVSSREEYSPGKIKSNIKKKCERIKSDE